MHDATKDLKNPQTKVFYYAEAVDKFLGTYYERLANTKVKRITTKNKQ